MRDGGSILLELCTGIKKEERNKECTGNEEMWRRGIERVAKNKDTYFGTLKGHLFWDGNSTNLATLSIHK